MTGKILPMEEILERMEKVDYNSIKSAIDYIFNADNMSFSAVGNVEGLDFEGMIEDGKKLLYSADR